MLFIAKLIPVLLFPVGLAILLSLLAAWYAFRAGARLGGFLALLGGAVLYAASIPVTAVALIKPLELENLPRAEYPKVAAIVLVGGGMGNSSAPRLHPETGWAGDRLLEAARLWRQGRAPVLVTTGGYITFLSSLEGSEAGLYANVLHELFDVPTKALRLVPYSKTTYDDAVMSAALFDSLGMKKQILLVTSASHMPRALALFRKQGFDATPAPTDFYSDTMELERRVFDFMPSSTFLAITGLALHEYLGLASYKILGRI